MYPCNFKMSWTKFALLGGVAYATGIVTGPIVLAAAAGMYFRGSRKKTIVVEKVIVVGDETQAEKTETKTETSSAPAAESK